jgi:hypothetical protein
MIRVKCSNCDKTLGVDDAKAGKTVNCPECQTPIKVPKGAKDKVVATKEKPSKPVKKVRPGDEEDDFDPYAVSKDTAPKMEDQTEAMDDMVRFAEAQKKRQKAWNKVGPPAKLMKIEGMISCIVFILAFLWMFATVVLYEHQLKLARTEHTDGGKGLGPPKPLVPLDMFLVAKDHAGFDNHWYVALLFFGIMLFGLTFFGIIIAGAEKMKKLESYGLAMTGAILMIIAMPPVGVMALLALRDEQVLKEFEETLKQQKRAAKLQSA